MKGNELCSAIIEPHRGVTTSKMRKLIENFEGIEDFFQSRNSLNFFVILTDSCSLQVLKTNLRGIATVETTKERVERKAAQ